ncbi:MULTISPECIES: hypothetical protein [Cellulosimicrobium]|uniref:hypothetical protein n=1 Tax=Cellulosimicrobium TaxID=157920 RepID=UPI00119DC4B8|nr:MULTISPECIES: hypothetical protein [Cellulosimicrobium]MBE9939171.1 hypothetical protein [Cellulosimicrobium cellulans]
MEPDDETGRPTDSAGRTVGQRAGSAVLGLVVAALLYLLAFPLAFAALFFAAGAFDDRCFSPDVGRVCAANPVGGAVAIVLGVVLLIAPGVFGIYLGRASEPARSTSDS